MSRHQDAGSASDNRQRAAEQQNAASHAFHVAEHNGKQDYLSPYELTRAAKEHVSPDHDPGGPMRVHGGIAEFGNDEIAALALELWRVRGCPEGSPEEDWRRAVEILRAGAISRA